MFIKVKDLNDGSGVLVNTDDISRIEERPAGCIIYFKSIADDFDGTKHQVSLAVEEDFNFFNWYLSHD